MKLGIVLALLAALSAAPEAQKATPVDALIDHASSYAHAFVSEFSTVVAEEHYMQDSHPMARVDAVGLGDVQSAPQHVELQSDLLFVQTDPPSKWLTFRDVASVNGQAVRDRSERLVRLFVDKAPDAVDRAWEITREGYRYNVGSADRTVASPLLALALLQPEYRARFEYRISRIDSSRGPDVWIVKFKERERPTILRTRDNGNVVAQGRFWIDGASGRVLQTELDTSVGDRVMTLFAHDERLHLDVPVEMRDLAWYRGTAITGVATYGNFRRFDVATGEAFR